MIKKENFTFANVVKNYAFEIEAHRLEKEKITEMFRSIYGNHKCKWVKETKDIIELCFIDGLTKRKNDFYKLAYKNYKDTYFINHTKNLDAGIHIHLFMEVEDNEKFFKEYIEKINITELEQLYLSCPFYLKQNKYGLYHRYAYGYSNFSKNKVWTHNSKSAMITLKNHGTTTKQKFFSIEFRKGEVTNPKHFFYYIALLDIVYNKLQDKLGLKLINKDSMKKLVQGDGKRYDKENSVNIEHLEPVIKSNTEEYKIMQENIKIIENYSKTIMKKYKFN